jgi:hypothetical protein
MHLVGAAVLVLLPLAGSGKAPTKAPATPTPAVRLTSAQKAQAQKTLASEIAKRQSLRSKQKAPPKGTPKFQAHRCAVIYDDSISGKQREADGPFRVSCTDWVYRATKELSIQDADHPCTARDYGPAFAGCTTWVDGFDDKKGKWTDVWRKSAP